MRAQPSASSAATAGSAALSHARRSARSSFRPAISPSPAGARRPTGFPDAHWTHDNQALADRSDIVILSVRPQDWQEIAVSAPDKLVISVMAGVTLAEIAARLGTDRVVRALPNAAAEVGHPTLPGRRPRRSPTPTG